MNKPLPAGNKPGVGNPDLFIFSPTSLALLHTFWLCWSSSSIDAVAPLQTHHTFFGCVISVEATHFIAAQKMSNKHMVEYVNNKYFEITSLTL